MRSTTRSSRRPFLSARCRPHNKPLKLTAAGFSHARCRTRHAAWYHHSRPQLSGHPLGRAGCLLAHIALPTTLISFLRSQKAGRVHAAAAEARGPRLGRHARLPWRAGRETGTAFHRSRAGSSCPGCTRSAAAGPGFRGRPGWAGVLVAHSARRAGPEQVLLPESLPNKALQLTRPGPAHWPAVVAWEPRAFLAEVSGPGRGP